VIGSCAELSFAQMTPLSNIFGYKLERRMNMTTQIKIAIILITLVVAGLWVTGGSAQQDGVGPQGVATNLAVRQDDSDAYWLDTNTWLEYGYRPHAVTPPTRYASAIPSYFAGSRGGYSFGINEPAGNAPWEGGAPDKFQMTKYGTWH
jgi:hypothetical protein